jgi:hypothetical protein
VLDIDELMGSNSRLGLLRRISMKKPLYLLVGAALLATGLLIPTSPSVAQETGAPGQRRPGFFHILGSILLTPPLLVVKTVTCVGTQVTAAVPYVATYGVEGGYDGGTNGRDIGETARRSCTGSWIVRPSQVVRDYGE